MFFIFMVVDCFERIRLGGYWFSIAGRKHKGRFWIGLNDRRKEGNFEWLDDNQTVRLLLYKALDFYFYSGAVVFGSWPRMSSKQRYARGYLNISF